MTEEEFLPILKKMQTIKIENSRPIRIFTSYIKDVSELTPIVEDMSSFWSFYIPWLGWSCEYQHDYDSYKLTVVLYGSIQKVEDD